jgi:hypothetical protein
VVGRRLLAAGALTLAACSGPADTGPPGPEPAGLVATLEDEVGAGGSWRTFWELCWDADPGAVAYELKTVTGEGASPKLRRQTDRCVRIEAAAGDGPAEERPARRAAQLAGQQGQLAFQVRGVPGQGPPGEWSPPVAVGSEGSVGG